MNNMRTLKMVAILLIGIILCGSVAYGQSKNDPKKPAKKASKVQVDPTLLSEDKVPAPVLKTFKKRFSTATEMQWHSTPNDTIVMVYYVMREVPMESEFGASGYWIETRETADPEKLLSACYKTLDVFYQNYKVKSAYKITRSDKNNQFLINILEPQNAKSQQLTKVYLDKSGRFIKAEAPEEKMGAEDNVVDKKASKEEAKIKKEFEKDRQLDIYPAKISGDELPNSIQRWIDKNYPDYLVKKVDYTTDEDFEAEGNIYIIMIQRSGINQPYATVWFTRDGDFLQLQDDFKKEQTVVEEKVKRPVTEEVKRAFEEKYPTVKTVQWEEDEDGNWVGNFTDKYGQNYAFYSNSGVWFYTRNVIDYAKVPYAVRTAVETNYPKYTVMNAYKVSAPEKKPYYTIELYLKKDKSTLIVDYQQTGKPLE